MKKIPVIILVIVLSVTLLAFWGAHDRKSDSELKYPATQVAALRKVLKKRDWPGKAWAHTLWSKLPNALKKRIPEPALAFLVQQSACYELEQLGLDTEGVVPAL